MQAETCLPPWSGRSQKCRVGPSSDMWALGQSHRRGAPRPDCAIALGWRVNSRHRTGRALPLTLSEASSRGHLDQKIPLLC